MTIYIYTMCILDISTLLLFNAFCNTTNLQLAGESHVFFLGFPRLNTGIWSVSSGLKCCFCGVVMKYGEFFELFWTKVWHTYMWTCLFLLDSAWQKLRHSQVTMFHSWISSRIILPLILPAESCHVSLAIAKLLCGSDGLFMFFSTWPSGNQT